MKSFSQQLLAEEMCSSGTVIIDQRCIHGEISYVLTVVDDFEMPCISWTFRMKPVLICGFDLRT